MIKKNKHLLKLLSLSLLPIAAISVPAILLTSCGNKKGESGDNSNNNSGDNSGNNNGDNNNNTTVANSTYPTFASADEVRKACDEAKIDSKYESEELFISETEYLSKFGSVLANNSKIANATIRYPQQDNLDTEKNEMDFMYITLFTTENKQISTNLSDYPMYLKDSSGNKWYINPNKAVRISFDELYMLSDEQLQYDSEEVQQMYKSYRDRRIWFKIDVSKYKEQVANLPISDSTNGYKLFIDYQQNLPNKNTNIMNSYIFRELDEENILSQHDLWTYRLSNDMRFGLKGDIINEYLYDFINMHDSHPSSYSYDTETIDPNKFGGVVAMKYLKQYPNAVRFIDSIVFNAGVSKGCSINSEQMWSNGAKFAYIMNSSQPVEKTNPLLPINQAYEQIKNGDPFPTLNVDAKKMYDNVDLSTLQSIEFENGLNWYVTSDSVKLIDLLVTVNGGKTFGFLPWEINFSDINASIDTTFYGFDTSRSIFFNDMGSYYYPIYGFSTGGQSHDGLFENYINNYSYSTFTINFNQPNIK